MFVDRDKVIKGLECCKEVAKDCDRCPYKDTDEERIARELFGTDNLRESLDVLCIALLHNEALELFEETEDLTLEERFDLNNIREIRNCKQSVRYIRNGSYVIVRRDIYDDYLARLRGDSGLKYVFKYNDTPVVINAEDIGEIDPAPVAQGEQAGSRADAQMARRGQDDIVDRKALRIPGSDSKEAYQG